MSIRLNPSQILGVNARTGLKALLAACAVALAFGNGGCGRPSNDAGGVAAGTEQASLQLAVLNLQTGQTIKEMNRDFALDPSATASLATATLGVGSMHSSAVFQNLTPTAPTAISVDAIHPCADVAPPSDAASDEVWHNALAVFGACLRQAMEPVELARGALVYQITFSRGVTEKALSRMTDAELKLFLKAEGALPGMLVGLSDEAAPKRTKLRNRFEDRDLDELTRLARALTQKLTVAEAKFFTAVDKNRRLVEHFAEVSNRYQLLLLLRDGALRGMGPTALATQISALLKVGGMQVPKSLLGFPASLLRPWSIVAIAPDLGRETDPLQATENPFLIVQRAVAQLGGSADRVYATREAYVRLRDSDNPAMPDHAAPDPQAVRIAVVDTGVDFLKYPALGEFLSNGRGGSMSSYDFQDDDANPYLPAEGPDSHGSGTAASVLTVMAHYAPQVLKQRKLDLAVWKLNTIRDSLATPYQGLVSWQSREAMPEALIREATDPSIEVKPKIVSISAIFQLQPFLANSNHPDAVLQAPWLWIMAAGNEGVQADLDKVPVCLSDVPQNKRVDARILCVGAIRHDILQDKIAGYSNFGNRVDLYAYESYIDLCPNGTSCSTPAVSGAAAAIAAQYPDLTPEEIKAVLLEAAEERTLEVDGSTAPVPQVQLIEGPLHESRRMSMYQASGENDSVTTPPAPINSVAPTVRRTVKVLDPSTMMSRIMEVAASHHLLNARQ